MCSQDESTSDFIAKSPDSLAHTQQKVPGQFWLPSFDTVVECGLKGLMLDGGTFGPACMRGAER